MRRWRWFLVPMALLGAGLFRSRTISALCEDVVPAAGPSYYASTSGARARLAGCPAEH
jgi:hypothetical protein